MIGLLFAPNKLLRLTPNTPSTLKRTYSTGGRTGGRTRSRNSKNWTHVSSSIPPDRICDGARNGVHKTARCGSPGGYDCVVSFSFSTVFLLHFTATKGMALGAKKGLGQKIACGFPTIGWTRLGLFLFDEMERKTRQALLKFALDFSDEFSFISVRLGVVESERERGKN